LRAEPQTDIKKLLSVKFESDAKGKDFEQRLLLNQLTSLGQGKIWPR
jgi:hypothetical protein